MGMIQFRLSKTGNAKIFQLARVRGSRSDNSSSGHEICFPKLEKLFEAETCLSQKQWDIIAQVTDPRIDIRIKPPEFVQCPRSTWRLRLRERRPGNYRFFERC